MKQQLNVGQEQKRFSVSVDQAPPHCKRFCEKRLRLDSGLQQEFLDEGQKQRPCCNKAFVNSTGWDDLT